MTRTAISTSAPFPATGASYFPVDPNRTTLVRPVPTNAWFENFIIGTGHEAITIFPYEVKALANGLDMCIPNANTSFPQAVLATMLQNFSFRSVQTPTECKLTAFTDLGCTLRWLAPGGNMTANIVRGMAYVTMNYSGITPLLNTQNAIVQINGSAVGATGTFTGTKLKLALNNGQTWLLYSSSTLTWTLSTANTLTASGIFTGTLRMAYMPQAADEAILDSSSTCISTGGSVDYTVSGNTATEVFSFNAIGLGSLLMYTLPHHRDWMSAAYQSPQITTLRGLMRSTLGATWTLNVPLPVVGWDNANPIASNRLAAVTTALAADKNFVPSVNDPYFGGKQLAKSARLALIAEQLGDTTARNLLLNNLKPVIDQYLAGNLSTTLRYDTVWGGIVSGAGLNLQDADFGNGRYNDHNFHYGYVVYAAAVIAKFDATWKTNNQSKINDLVRDFCNPSATDTWFTPMRSFDWFEAHSWAAGNFEFGDNRNQESTSEAVNAWYGLYLWGTATAQTQLTQLGRFLLANEIAAAQKYWQMKQADTIYPQPFRSKGVVGIVWSNKVDYATFFGAQDEYIHGIQMLPITPATELLIPDDWITEDWVNILAPLWTRTSVWRAEMVSGGSGYTASQFASDGTGFTNGLVATGGTGSGLGFNVNIAGGQIVAPYIIFNQHGLGYTNGEIVTLNGSGGTGAQIRIWTQPEDGWKAVLLGAYSQINPDDAWNKTLALSQFDDGSSKTQALVHIASQSAGTGPGVLPLSGSAISTSTTTGAIGLSSSKSLSGASRSISSTTGAIRILSMGLGTGSAVSISRTTGLLQLQVLNPEPPPPVEPPPVEPPPAPEFPWLRDRPWQHWVGMIRSGLGHHNLTNSQLAEIYFRHLNGETYQSMAVEFGLPESVMQKVIDRLPH